MDRSCNWLSGMRRYLAVIAAGNLAWEIAQMPLYTLWWTASAREIGIAVIHCTGGDLLLAVSALIASLLLFGSADWPRSRFLWVGGMAIALGFSYTIGSEHLNTARNVWAYSEWMPILPGLGTGLAPFAQWIVVPLLAFAVALLPLSSEARAGQAWRSP